MVSPIHISSLLPTFEKYGLEIPDHFAIHDLNCLLMDPNMNAEAWGLYKCLKLEQFSMSTDTDYGCGSIMFQLRI